MTLKDDAKKTLPSMTPSQIFSQILKMSLLVLAQAFAMPAGATDTAKTNLKIIPLTAKAMQTKLASQKDKGVVLNLWATWCEPCKAEMPELIKFQQEHKKDGLDLILLTGDAESDQKEVEDFLVHLKVDFPIYRLAEDPEAFMKNFVNNWPAQVPTTLLFGPDGRLKAQWFGRVKIKDLESKIQGMRH
jgi:thiol-disulfide isomerase/thioredoxin